DAVLVEPDETLVHLGDQAWTRREVEAMDPELAIEPGAIVAVQLPNGPELIATLFAVWAAGGVYVPLNPRAAAGEVALVLEEVDPAAVVTAGGVDPRESGRRHERDVALVSFTSGTTGRPRPVELRHSTVATL